jgi:hypothetical protein
MSRGIIARTLVTGLVALALATGCSPGATTAPATPTPAASAAVTTPTATPTAAPTPTPTPMPTPTLWTDGKAAAVVGSMDCNTVVKAGAESSPGVMPNTLTHQILSCVVTTNDKRVNGSGRLDLNIASWDPKQGYNAIDWGYQEIVLPEGSWAGRTYGIYDNDGVAHGYGVMVGSGAYEGLIFSTSGTVPFNSAVVAIIGLIQPGSPPPGFPVGPFAPWPAS